jgi:hypothetical protein
MEEKRPWYALERKGRVGLRPHLNMVARKEIPASARNQTLVIQPVTSLIKTKLGKYSIIFNKNSHKSSTFLTLA